MARTSGLGRTLGVAAAVALLVTAIALLVAVAAAASGTAQRRELSGRLLPASSAADLIASLFTEEQASLRQYVSTGRAAALGPFRQAAALIPGQAARVGALGGRYPQVEGQLDSVVSALGAWRARVAGPELAAGARGDFARALAIQSDYPLSRRYSLPARRGIAALQAQLTRAQEQVTARLATDQASLLAALLAVCAVVAVSTVAGALMVRRWLLRPLTAVQQAAMSVAGGDHDTTVPAAGPAELADLGRATDLMRTRLVAALAEAERAEHGFRGLFEASPDAMLAGAADGSIVMANRRSGELFGYSPAELIGQPMANLFAVGERDAYLRRREQYFADPASVPMGKAEARTMVHRQGRQFPVEVGLSWLPTGEGGVVVGSFRDISERLEAQAEQERLRREADLDRKAYERRVQQSERLESLGQLVGGVAHDFNNLLNVITGYAELIGDDVAGLAGEDNAVRSVLDDIGEIRTAAERAARLTAQLLVFARRDVIHPVTLDVSEVTRGVEQLLRRTLGEHIELIISSAPGLWPVTADPGQLEQVLVNLAVNARDAMPSGGKLTFDIQNITVDEAYPADGQSPLQPGRYVRLRVSDVGTGMARAVADRAFEPFYTTKEPGRGTGLGLASVHGIVTRAGGYVKIFSEPGIGTTVSALLPATAEPTPSLGRPSLAAPGGAPDRGRGEVILLVEDEKSLWQLTKRVLDRHGYRVCSAGTPAEALHQASDPHQPIDLLLTDLVMPDMLGNQLAAHIRAIRPGVPVLYMSGYARPILDRQGALEPGVDLLEKPFAQTTLLSRIRRALDQALDPAGGPADPRSAERPAPGR